MTIIQTATENLHRLFTEGRERSLEHAKKILSRAKKDPRGFSKQSSIYLIYVFAIWTYSKKLYTPASSAITDLTRSVIFNEEQLNPSFYGAEFLVRISSIVLLIFFLLAKNEFRNMREPYRWEGWIVSALAIIFALIAPFVVGILDPSPTSGLPLLLLGTPLVIGLVLSTGGLNFDGKINPDWKSVLLGCTPIVVFVLFCLFGTNFAPFLTRDIPMTLSALFTIIVVYVSVDISQGKSNPHLMNVKNSGFAFIIFSPALLFLITRLMFLIQNPDENVTRRWDIDWGFMNQPNTFDFPQTWPIELDFGAATRWDYYWAVVLQSARATLLAIILCTILGTLIGVLRLSSNRLASGMATFYVELFRNFPLAILLFVIMTYFGQTLPLKGSADAWVLGSNDEQTSGLLYISGQGHYIPLFELWRAGFLVTIMVSIWLFFRFQQRDGVDDSNEAVIKRSGIWGAGLILGLFVLLGDYQTPLLEVKNPDAPATWVPYPDSAFVITNPFIQLVLGLTLFTASVVAEIVRGSIQSLPSGQVEAAVSLGLSPYQRLRLVILPQALRSMVPMLNSQYMNVWKNSSLAIVVSYPDIFKLIQIMMTNVGKLIPLFMLLLVTYQAGSLLISGIMNAYNSRVTKVRI